FAFARVVADEHMPGLGAQARAAAVGAGLDVAVFAKLFAHGGRVGFAPAAFQVGNDALEGVPLDGAAALFVQVDERDFFIARAVEHLAAQVFRQVFEGRVDVELVMRGQAGQQRVGKGVAAVPAPDGAGRQAELRKRHHPLGVEEADLTDAVASGTGAHGVVEAEQPRFELGQAVAAYRAGVAAGKYLLASAVHVQGHRAAVGQLHGGFEAFGQALFAFGLDAQAVDHDVDVVLFVFLQRRHVADFLHLAVDPQAHVALGLQAGAFVFETALARAGDGGQHRQPRVGRPGQHGVDHLADALRLQGQAMVGAVRRAHPGVQQPQVIVDFRDGAHGGARVVSSGLLLDGNRRRQAFDEVDVGLVHQLQELPRVGRQAFYIAALPFGVQGVERQRGLARAGQARYHHQLVAGQVERDVLEVVGARTPNAYRVHQAFQRFQRPTWYYSAPSPFSY